MSESVTVIEVVARVADETGKGAGSATKNVSKLEQAMQKTQKQIESMKGKSKFEVVMGLKDMATKGISTTVSKLKTFAGKAWSVTVGIVDKVTAPLRGIAKMVANPLVAFAGMAGITLGVKEVVSTFADFEQKMANVHAITGASVEDFSRLNATAKELGATTVFSASEAADGMTYLGMAGWKTNDIIAAMPGLLNLAAAGATDLGTAADIVSNVMTAFGMEAGEAGRAADIFAAASSNSNTSITMLGESFTYAGALAGTYGYELGEVTTALGLMANQGVRGSMAGTAFQATIQGLADTSGESGEVLEKLGLTLFDTTGKAKPFKNVMNDLRTAFKGLTDQEKANYATTIAGERGMKGLLAIVNASDEEYNELADSIEKSTGVAEKMANIQMDTLSGGFKLIKSAVEDVYIALGEHLQPYLKKFQSWIIEKMPKIKEVALRVADRIVRKVNDIIGAVKDLVASPEWKKAETLWDKIEIAWGKLIAEPFDGWWNSTGKAWVAEKMASVGKGIGTALKTGLLGLLGVETGDAIGEGASIGKAFADGFIEGFDPKKVASGIWEAFKGIFKDATTLLPGGKETSSTAPLSAALAGYGVLKTGKAIKGTYKGIKAVAKGGKGIFNAIRGVMTTAPVAEVGATGLFGGIRTGAQMFKAANVPGAGAAAQSAATFARAGQLGKGVQFGAKVAEGGAKVASVGARAIPLIGGLISLAEMGFDAKEGVGRAKEWTGGNSLGNKIASGAGAFFGGTGDGVTGKKSVLGKGMDIGSGALKDAGIGAAVGSIVPGIGTAIGAGVGAGVGILTSAIGGENIAKFFSKAGETISDFFSGPFVDFFSELWGGISGFFTETIPEAASNVGDAIKTFFTDSVPGFFRNLWEGISGFFVGTIGGAISNVGNAIKGFFTETIPIFFENIWDGITGFFTKTLPSAIDSIGSAIGNFFTRTIPNAIQNVISAAANFFGKTVPYAIGFVVGKIKVFFTETIPGAWEDLWSTISNFFTQTIPATIATVSETITTFFTQTLPAFFTKLWNTVTNFFTQTVPAAINAIRATISTFFMRTIPNFFIGIWGAVSGFFTTYIAPALGAIGETLATFFTETVPNFFTNIWNGITTFFTEKVPAALTAIGETLGTFFTETVPEFFGEVWDGVSGFFTETIPSALATVGYALKTFFTETIPNFFSDLWDGVTSFFEETIPGVIESVKEGISGFFATAKEKITGFFSGIWDGVTEFFGGAATSFSEGYGDATAHASGGIMTSPHLGLVAEDGAEAIIPLSGKRRSRGLSLWAQAGEMLGVKPYADGGIVGTQPMPQVTGGGNSGASVSVPVSIGNITFEVNAGSGTASADTIMQTIKDNVASLTDEIAYQIAVSLQQAFANMGTV
ncbi:phage tail tape measure protein [Lachnospiraceae bacterium ZAX-1]